MSNPNNPFGLRPISRDSGGPLTTREYGKLSGDATAIFMFDPVLKVAGSVPAPTGLGNPMPGITSGQNGTPGTSLWQGVNLNYGAASVATAQYVIESLDALFIAQCNGATAITNAAHAGMNANLAIGTGNLLTKQSTFAVSSASIATTAALDLRIVKVSNISPNAEGANAIVEVEFMRSQEGQETTGVA